MDDAGATGTASRRRWCLIGTDVITAYVVADDQFSLSEAVFGNMGMGASGAGATMAGGFARVATGATSIVGLDVTGNGAIVVVEDEGIFFIEAGATVGGTGVDGVADAEKAMIASITSTNTTGDIAATDFDIVA